MSNQTQQVGSKEVSPADQAAQDKMQDMPIVLNLTLRKVNYILSIMSQLPYEKSFQPIADIQQMVMAQVQEIQAKAQSEAAAAEASKAEPEVTAEA